MSGHPDWVRYCVTAIIVYGLLCASCARPIREIQVEVPEGYTGHLHITTCAIPPMRADLRGNAAVADCPVPSEKIQLIVRRGGEMHQISPEKLTVNASADGLPVTIDGVLP
jgi:hypothetical protein